MKKKTFQNEAYIVPETDTLNYVTKSSTQEQRAKLDIGGIFINAAVCLKCSEYIRSKHRHDFKFCKCGAVGIDGGSWYAKRLGEEEDRIDIIEAFYDS